MTLVVTNMHDDDELHRWRMLERQDALVAQQKRHRRSVERARAALTAFAADGSCYAGVSWGKDSVCLAHLVATTVQHVTLVWVRIEPVANPECEIVRDAFLAQFPKVAYDEIVVDYLPGETEWVEGYGPRKTGLHPPAHQRGFAVARARYGTRHISGIRAMESKARERRMRTYGHSTESTCAPLGWWRVEDVWAYLHGHELPVHPAYAYTMHGAVSRDRIRVDALWGPSGTGWGRREWERRYYPDALRRVRAWCLRCLRHSGGAP